MRDNLRAAEPSSGSELAARSAAASEAEPHQYRPATVRTGETLTERLERVLWSVTYWWSSAPLAATRSVASWLARARGGSRDER